MWGGGGGDEGGYNKLVRTQEGVGGITKRTCTYQVGGPFFTKNCVRTKWMNPCARVSFLTRDEPFWGCSRMGGGQKGPTPSLKSVTHILQ